MYDQRNPKRPRETKNIYDDKAWAQQNIVLKRKDPGFSSEIFSRIAEEAAQRCSTAKDMNKPAQVRMFYEELVRLQSKVSGAGSKADEELQNVLPYIKMIRARLAYANGRKLIDERFLDIFSVCIEKVNDVESLKHCKLFFEAYLGFKKALGE